MRSDLEIIQGVADRVGLGAELAGSARDWKERFLARIAPKGASIEALENGPVRSPEAEMVLFEGRRFRTPDGLFHLLTDLPPEVAPPTREYPLYLLAIATEKSQASQTTAAFQEGPAEAVVHPSSAGDLPDGALGVLESRVGAMTVQVKHDSSQRRDVVIVPKGGWLHAGRCANALIPAACTDLGEGGVYLDECVRLVPAVS